MLVYGAYHGLLVPGHEIAGAWGARRDNKRDRTRSKPQDTVRGTSDQHAPYPLCKGVSATPDHNTVNVELSCCLHEFVRRCSHTLKYLYTFGSNPLLLQGGTRSPQGTFCLQTLLSRRRQGAKRPARLPPRERGCIGNRDHMKHDDMEVRRGLLQERARSTKSVLCRRGEAHINP